MAEKDITEKMLESFPDVFADIVNVLIYKGKQVVKPEDLQDMNTWEAYKSQAGLGYMERDVAKWWNSNNIHIASVGIENQSAEDNRMVLRVYGYDGVEYRNQCTEENRKHPAYPVITLVLYFGTDHRWKAPKTLYNTVHLSDELKPYVTNVKINVFNIAWLTPEQVSQFKSDFRIVADYFTQVRKTGKYTGSQDKIEHIYQVLKLLSVMQNDDRFIKAWYDTKTKGEPHTMCDVLDRLEEKVLEKAEKDFAKEKKNMEKNFAKEKEEMQESIAKKMLAAGMSRSEVAECCGLSMAKISRLAKLVAAVV